MRKHSAPPVPTPYDGQIAKFNLIEGHAEGIVSLTVLKAKASAYRLGHQAGYKEGYLAGEHRIAGAVKKLLEAL